MNCQETRDTLVDFGWTGEERSRAAAAIQHLAECDACRAAAEDFERVERLLLSSRREDGVPVEGWEAFEDRLESTARHGGRAAMRPRMFRFAQFGGALAASLLIAAVAYRLGLSRGMGPVSVAPVERPAAQFAPGEVSQQVRAFGEVSQVFDGRASWVVMANNASDLGLASQPVAARGLLLLKLTMLRSGEAVSSADLVIVPGQSAELTVPMRDSPGQSLHYRVGTSRGEPTDLTLWAEVVRSGDGIAAGLARGGRPVGAEPVAALATTLQLGDEQRLTAGRLVTSAGAYELQIAFARAGMGGERAGTRARRPGEGS